MKPRVVINISNSNSGGGRQIGLWFVGRMLARRDRLPFQPTYIVSQQQLGALDLTGQDFLAVPASPMRSLTSRRQIAALLKSQPFDMVFSVFGPSGISHPRQVSGLANTFVTSLSREVLRQVFPRSWPIQYLRYLWFGRSIAQEQALIFETQVERDKFVRRFGYAVDRTYVVGNSINDIFLSFAPAPSSPLEPGRGPRVLFVTGTQPHKNNHMIPSYVLALKRAGINDFTLALTLTKTAAEPWLAELSDTRHIEFLGSLSPSSLLEEYKRCHIVAHPSSLETYSAVYNEVRFVPRALLASDRPFAREICNRFAHFYEPLDAGDFAQAVVKLLSDLPQAEKAAWDARDDVLHPEVKFERVLEIIGAELARGAAS